MRVGNTVFAAYGRIYFQLTAPNWYSREIK
jgi:hypothetical protein